MANNPKLSKSLALMAVMAEGEKLRKKEEKKGSGRAGRAISQEKTSGVKPIKQVEQKSEWEPVGIFRVSIRPMPEDQM